MHPFVLFESVPNRPLCEFGVFPFRHGCTFWMGFFGASSKICRGLLRAELRGVGSDFEVAIEAREGDMCLVGVFGSVRKLGSSESLVL